jgi:hypothetical protein
MRSPAQEDRTMTLGKASAVAAGMLAAFALGIWVGPHVVHQPAPPSAAVATVGETPAPAAHARAARPGAGTPSDTAEADEGPITTSVPVSAPELQARLKPLMNRGTDMTLAADGFGDAGEFAAIAHAAHNTDVPFVVLKHRVLNEKKTLAAAIHESKPELDARLEAHRAWIEARSDLAGLEG